MIDVLYSKEAIDRRIQEMAQELAKDWKDNTILIALLKGSFVFTADLIRALYTVGVSPQIDFMTLSSYGEGMESSGSIVIQKDITDTVSGRQVLLVDDILESGRTLALAKQLLLERGAAQVKVAVMLEKPGKRVMDIQADIVGFVISDVFVVGFGLDYANYYRELPFIGVLKEADYDTIT